MYKTKVHMLLVALVVIGAINWGTTAIGYNFVKLLSNGINQSFNTNYPINKVIYFIVAISAIWLASKRSTWLPFLGESVLPDSLMPLRTPSKSNIKVKIQTMPNAKIAYWAALPSADKQIVEKAYGDYSNSGVVMADENGLAELPLLDGNGYILPSGTVLEKHVHYRILGLQYGMIGEVHTVNY